jgi:hypothetical protein
MTFPGKVSYITGILWALAGLILLFSLPGCKSPFRTRESPPPAAETEGTWETPSQPENVLNNLLHSYNELVITNFDHCLCDSSFAFSAPEDSIKAIQDNREELFADWDRNTEIRVTTQVFNIFQSNPDSISLELRFDPDPPIADDINDSTAVLLRDYELVIVEMEADSWSLTSAKGTATFYLEQTSLNWWCICFWSDLPDTAGGYDWGDFKAQFR